MVVEPNLSYLFPTLEAILLFFAFFKLKCHINCVGDMRGEKEMAEPNLKGKEERKEQKKTKYQRHSEKKNRKSNSLKTYMFV